MGEKIIGFIMLTLVVTVGAWLGYYLYKDESKLIKKNMVNIDVSSEIFKAFELYQEERKYEEAYKIFLKYAKKGDALAQYYLAQMYLDKEFSRKGDKKAFNWMEKSAKQGNGEAIESISQMYRDGIGTKVDISKADYYMKKIGK